MKLLQIHAEFKLPDDFDGSFSDALREMAMYCESPEANEREELRDDKEDKGITIIDWECKAIKELIAKNRAKGNKIVVDKYIGIWD